MAMEFAESKKKRKPLPGYVIAIIVFGSISIIFGVIKGVVQAQTEQTMAQVNDLMNGGNTSYTSSTTSYVGVTPVNYKGLSIKIPKGWKSETSEEAGGIIHQIYVESADVDYSTISWGRSSNMMSPKEWIQTMHDTGGEDFPNFSPGEITDITYCGQNAYSLSCSMKKLGFTYYAKIITFQKGGNTFMVMNMSDLRSNLSKKFGFVEETLTIN